MFCILRSCALYVDIAKYYFFDRLDVAVHDVIFVCGYCKVLFI